MSAPIERVTEVTRVTRDFYITPYGSNLFLDEVLASQGEKSAHRIQGDVGISRHSRHAPAQHWLDSLLDDAPAITPAAPPTTHTTGARAFRVRVPDRPAFGVICPQGIEAVRAQWPGAEVEAIR
ncbi:hypothetical protein [Thauera chlorobenzoica]|uniref:hypothetical protein n=1 Tax=Thauera chlorobenzoica TaxID=96773 RepID=UPI0011B0085B|nr:hypothetical protein [Thauera chlorobenzoica]